MKTVHQIAQCLTLMLPQNEQPRPKPVTITLVATSEEVPLAQFATALTEACAKLGSTKRINLSLFRQSQSRSFAACDDLHWIDVQSHGRRFVIFQMHPQAQAWTELGVQRADVVLLVGKFGASPAHGRSERLIQHLLAEQPNTRVELVLLSDGETTQLASESEWLAGRRVTAQHYVNLKGQRDFDRLACSFKRSDNETPQSISSGNWHWDTDSMARVYA
jgi:hypothetical protein